MSAATALVLVSHSAQLAAGAVEVAQQMAPDVAIRAAGGTEDGRIGTSYDLVERAVTALLDGGAAAVAILTDLGSAALTAESVVDVLDDDRVVMVDAPFVEGAVAAAVAAQSGGDASAVGTAARTAIDSFGGSTAVGASTTAGDVAAEAADAVERSVVLRNRLGLHARPAATLARKAADFDAEVTLNGVDAASVLALMGLGLTGGAELRLRATGPQAAQALEAIVADVEAGFGEE
ncbi:dihydroxyacetone kinase phosphoryl donor subunit DhaM [Occultella gossypii]|uniref:Phosphocarrier protein HPr n=1 Tax=Occultella gossypii TaxID=2800820 RepID=A0ABS7S7F7_9MICO|nr:dihydroxyacetone kinase phosphoryl donor subunit DhaM [Occultella gossypii]MBZ2196017.1 PTS-dependent dihydroxyacetone kinase phosphotransferase subunit DhaM [Occultella gossypii]